MTSPRTLLNAWRISPKKQLGQNFLSDPSTARMILDRAGIGPEDTVLEIGAGLGALTLPLARMARKVIAVEKDPEMIDLLRAELLAGGVPEGERVEIRPGDILKMDIGEIAQAAGDQLVVTGNLPYNISSPVVVKLVASRTHVRRAVLMFQKEMARRLAAGPGTKVYGRLSVMLAYCAAVRSVARIPARSFYPRPRVDSEVLSIDFFRTPPVVADDEDFLFEVVKAAFGKRRKTLKNALSGSGLRLDAAGAEASLIEAEIQPTRRAETLTVAELVRLSRTAHRHLADGG
jgi:16S rRNA (adenine1518-N6/adenine1519-N6)-dimethyltransferase